MIDEKIIGAAGDKIFSYVHDDEDRICAKTGFMHGINWFIQAIWHNASEEPEDNKEFIMYDDKNWKEITSYVHDGPYSWMHFVSTFGFTKWCYIEDILPKECKK